MIIIYERQSIINNELHQWSEVVSDTGVDGRVIKFITYQKFKEHSQKI